MSKLLDPQEFWESVRGEESAAWPVVCVDLNGVLDQYTGWNGLVETFPPAEGADRFLTELRKRFNTVVVFTAIQPLSVAEGWLVETGLDKYVDYITSFKIPAQLYIDDKGIQHRGDFDETLRLIDSFVPHWK